MAAAEWVVNSVQMAMTHDLKTTSEDFKRASDDHSKNGHKDGHITARSEAKGPASADGIGHVLDTRKPEKHCKPKKKRASSHLPETRSVDDIGLEPTTSTMSTWFQVPETRVFTAFFVPWVP